MDQIRLVQGVHLKLLQKFPFHWLQIKLLHKKVGNFELYMKVGDTMDHVCYSSTYVPAYERFACIQPTGHFFYGSFLTFGIGINMVEIPPPFLFSEPNLEKFCPLLVFNLQATFLVGYF